MATATLKEIATRAGVSIETVSRVLNGKNKEVWSSTAHRAARIRKIAMDLNFRPNAAARSLRSRRTHQVGVLIRNAPDAPVTALPSYETILGINQGLEQFGYVLSIVRISDVPDDGHVSRVFLERILDGIIVLGLIPPGICDRIGDISPHSVWVNSNTWQPSYCIRPDERHTGRLIARNLIELGYRRLVWVDDEYEDHPSHYSRVHRYEGIRQVAAERGVKLEHFKFSKKPEHIEQEMSLFAGRLNSQAVVIAYNSYFAQQTANGMMGLGLLAGRDFGLASCDDMYDTSNVWPGLARVVASRFDLGLQAAKMMVAVLKHPDRPCPSRELRGPWHAGSTVPGPNYAFGKTATV